MLETSLGGLPARPALSPSVAVYLPRLETTPVPHPPPLELPSGFYQFAVKMAHFVDVTSDDISERGTCDSAILIARGLRASINLSTFFQRREWPRLPIPARDTPRNTVARYRREEEQEV